MGAAEPEAKANRFAATMPARMLKETRSASPNIARSRDVFDRACLSCESPDEAQPTTSGRHREVVKKLQGCVVPVASAGPVGSQRRSQQVDV
jgi:hypothetical protein